MAGRSLRAHYSVVEELDVCRTSGTGLFRKIRGTFACDSTIRHETKDSHATGRREEVSEYSIISGTIYSKADYWTTGSWTKKIQIADLDVPATLKINQERGLKFVLPTSPNQVVIRP